MDLSLFDYELPGDRIAQEKSSPRDSSRLFYIDTTVSPVRHKHLRFNDIISLFDPGDTLILNRSRVIPARIPVRKPTGGKGEVLLLERSSKYAWTALVGGKNIGIDTDLYTDDPSMKVRIKDRLYEGKCRIEMISGGDKAGHGEVLEWLKDWGYMPTPPYIKRLLSDQEEYQTVYGDVEGSVAAPTAGLHFTEELLDRISSTGVRIEYVVLHVGLGTFAPVRSNDITEHSMEEEEYIVPVSVKDAVQRSVESFSETGRSSLWAVGTTVMRTLESAFDEDGRCIKDKGRTGLYITPGHDFKLPYKGFLTNFHLPRSTPLILVSAFYDREKVLEAYQEAVDRGYRFYSLGDSMAIRRGA